MTREQVTSAYFNGAHVYDDFGARGRIVSVEDAPGTIARVNWIGENNGPKDVQFDRLNLTNPRVQ